MTKIFVNFGHCEERSNLTNNET